MIKFNYHRCSKCDTVLELQTNLKHKEKNSGYNFKCLSCGLETKETSRFKMTDPFLPSNNDVSNFLK